MSVTNVTITGQVPQLVNFPPASISFALSGQIVNGGQLVPSAPAFTVQASAAYASAGVFSLTVAANDDPTSVPQDTYYHVTVVDASKVLYSVDLLVQAAAAPTTTLQSLPVVLSAVNGVTSYSMGPLSVQRTVLTAEVDVGHDVVLLDATSGAFTVYLPNAARGPGRVFTFRSLTTNSNLVTINAMLGSTIDVVSSNSVWGSITLVSDGIGWRSI